MIESEDMPGSRDPVAERIPSSGGYGLTWILMTHAILAAQGILVGTVLLVPQDFLKLHAHYFYLIHYGLFLPFLFTSRDRCAFLFSPSFLIISYVCVSFIIGGFAFSRRYVLLPGDLADFSHWDHLNFATVYFMLCNMLALVAYFLAGRKRPAREPYRLGGSLAQYAPQLVAGGAILLVSILVSVGLPPVGGIADFAIAARFFGLLVLSIVMVKVRWRYRYFAYVGFLLLLAAAEYTNRRLALILVISLMFIEAAHLRDLRLTLRRILLLAAVLAIIAVLQITMTIARGLNGFKGSYWQAFGRMDSFMKLKNFDTYALKQTEGPATFFHSNNALHYVVHDPSFLSYGSTLAKTLFIVVPRSVWPDKPRSMVEIYTSHWWPAFRGRGGSTGINVYAEYFWNFHVFGGFCVIPIFYILNKVFFLYLFRLRADTVWSVIYLGIGYNSLLMYARGHGLHSLAIDLLLAFVTQVAVFNLLVPPSARKGAPVHPALVSSPRRSAGRIAARR